VLFYFKPVELFYLLHADCRAGLASNFNITFDYSGISSSSFDPVDDMLIFAKNTIDQTSIKGFLWKTEY
jgi:hypothetical protein